MPHALAIGLPQRAESLPPWLWPLVLGALGLYVAARFATGALVGRNGYAAAPAGAVALGHWAPIACVAAAALLHGRADIALGIAFTTAVGSLLLAVGMTAMLSPPARLPGTRRAWSFLLPAGLLPMLAGFGSNLTVVHAGMLLLLGLAVWSVWRAGEETERDAGELADAVASTVAPGVSRENEPAPATGAAPAPVVAYAQEKPADPWGGVARAVQWVLAVGLAIVAARAVVMGMVRADSASKMLRAGVLVAGAVGPALTLPLLAAGTDLAQRGRAGDGCSAFVGVALLNVFLLVPAIVFGRWFQSIYGGVVLLPEEPFTGAGVRPWLDELFDLVGRVPSTPLPMAVWRVDTVVLTVAGLLLVPVAAGRWRLGRLEAIVLLVGYAVYLAVKALLGANPFA